MCGRLLQDGDENKGRKRKRSESKRCCEVNLAAPTNQAQEPKMPRAHFIAANFSFPRSVCVPSVLFTIRLITSVEEEPIKTV
jgi:hypothetical protein